MFIEDIFIMSEVDGKFMLKIKEQPQTYGIIEKEISGSKYVYSITYYWNNVFQDKTYEDDVKAAKDKLKNILMQIYKQSQNFEKMKYIKSFEKYFENNRFISRR